MGDVPNAIPLALEAGHPEKNPHLSLEPDTRCHTYVESRIHTDKQGVVPDVLEFHLFERSRRL